jgi:Zn-dependent metalloprotease
MIRHRRQHPDARPTGVWVSRIRESFLACATCIGASILAIALSLLALSLFVLAVGASGAGGLAMSARPLHVAVDDGAVLFYLTQLISVSFFEHTAGVRFAALPGLCLTAASIAVSAMLATRLLAGSARKRLVMAVLVAIPYALLAGLGARYLPLRLTSPGIGRDTTVLPATGEAFLLPLVWGLLFAPLGGLIGVFGKRWTHEGARLLGAWAAALRCTLRTLVRSLAITSAAVIVGGLILAIRTGATGSIAGVGVGHALALVLGVLIVLPSLIVTTFLACFGVSFDWRVEALSRTHGSGSILGGTLPAGAGSVAHQLPVLVLLTTLGAATVVSAGWLTARREPDDPVRSLANALRTGALMTLACWLFGLVSRVDAQAGGFLGLHFAVDAGSLLWRAPVWCFLGSITGSFSYHAIRGASPRHQLTAALLSGLRPSRAQQAGSAWIASWRETLAARAALAAGFLVLPAMLIGIGSAGATTTTRAPTISLAPISQAAERELRRDAVPGSHLSVTVDPGTRAVDSASTRIRLGALGIPTDQSPVAKARAVLARYGHLFGLTRGTSELGEPQVVTDPLTKAKSHVYFTQTVDGLPVLGSTIGVHFSRDGKTLDFVNNSLVPEVSLADSKAAISSTRAISLAKAALPDGKLVHAPRLEIYTGEPSHPFGPTARLAWLVWLTAGPLNASNEYVIDADSGSILHTFVKSFNLEYREIDTAKHETTLPGTHARLEGEGATGDEDTNHAYEYIGDAYSFFKELEEEPWEGYEGKGKKHELATVHYGLEDKKAEWYGAGQEIVFGDGYPAAMDVVGHEYAEAITEHSADEEDEGESGAIAEGFADAMGAALEGHVTGKEPNWIYGTGEPTGGTHRSLKEPKEYEEISGYPDPKTLSQYRTVCQDNEDIHENSTIISHAFYLLATKSGSSVAKAAKVFFLMQTMYLDHTPRAKFEQARDAAIQASERIFGEGSSEVTDTVEAFDEVGLNGVANPPAFSCTTKNGTECAFEDALDDQEPAHGTTSTVAMLATLYHARGALAQTSAAGHRFLPLYEANMGRITELVSRDPTLEEMAVGGLQQIAPALESLAEGEGQKYTLSAWEMSEIEAALKRLAQDDRIYSGGGTLAQLIERELKWLRLPSYAGMTYASGFKHLNHAVLRHGEKAPPPSVTLVDPNCSEKPYHNEFQVNSFTVDTPGHYKPGEVSPVVASGIACGTQVEVAGGKPFECRDKEHPLNTSLNLELPPGDKVDPGKELAYGAYVGRAAGTIIACAGEKSEMIEGNVAITSLTEPAGQCPAGVIDCFRVEGSFDKHEGRGYAWVKESAGKRLTLTTGPVDVEVLDEGEAIKVPIGFTAFTVELCARAGTSGACGTGSATWVHKNGEETQNCETEAGTYVMRVTNRAEATSLPARSCVYWGEGAHKNEVDPGNSIAAVSCIPRTTECVVADNKGNALYSTNVSASAASTWKSWSGPASTSPAEAIACPSSTVCALGDGKVGEGDPGGNMYYATSLGGSWSEAFKPSSGVLAVTCPSASFCVSGGEHGAVRYATKPASTSWTSLTVGSAANSSVFCLSSSFCALVNASGDLYVADSEAKIKEAAGWKLTDIDGSTALTGVACSSTSTCVAVDGAGDIINLAINGSGEATATNHDTDGSNDLTAVTCMGELTCAAVDSTGHVFVSTSGGATWNEQQSLGTDLTSVSCASSTLCAAADTTGHVTAFAPAGVPPSHTQTIDSGNSLGAVSCIPGKADCVVADSVGNAYYSTSVSASASATSTWTSWTGPASPGEAIACPSTTVCALAAGHVETGSPGGDMYYATSLGGTWTSAFSPTYGVLAISCPSASFCVDSQEGGGFIHYTTKPASTEWTSVSIGSGSMNAVSCLSSAFCAVVDGTGHVHVANTEAKIKEASGWKSTDIDGTTALHGIACTSTTSCVAIDGGANGDVFDLTLNSSGEATVSKEDIDATNTLTGVACTEGMCVVVDSKGNVFVSGNGGETWKNEHTFGTDLTGVACASNELCVATDTKGEVTAFEPE